MNVARKRTQSMSSNAGGVSKKRRKFSHKRDFVPPSKFLLGGNIRDPLNLCGLKEDETPSAEDVSFSPSEFLLGGDIHDPLNLKNADPDESSDSNLEDAFRSETFGDNNNVGKRETTNEVAAETSQKDTNENVQNVFAKKLDRKDRIVSPVIPQPYRPVPFQRKIETPIIVKGQKTPKFNDKNSRFSFGNYNRYYGYRNTNHSVDPRLEILAKHREFFEGKDVLDIGCNIGHISLIIARDFGAKSVTGIDVDRTLVNVAKKNIKHYINCTSPYSQGNTPCHSEDRKVDLKNKCYPVSMPILYGPVREEHYVQEGPFPKNVHFVHGNYVLESDFLLGMEKQRFDTVLCLSTTKWIHLNWGDEGLKRVFKRIFLQLRPGGIFILEPQCWDSYKKKKNLTETIWRNYHKIQLFPHHFDEYLLSAEVGFLRYQTLALINHPHKGFRRPLKVFYKSAEVSTSSNTTGFHIGPERMDEEFTSQTDTEEDTKGHDFKATTSAALQTS